jgi:hypothetical protein
MSPTENTIGLVPDDTKEIVTYYSSCNGTNPLQEPLILALNYTYLMNSTINVLTSSTGSCPGDPNLMACYADTRAIVDSLTAISVSAQCPPVKEQWDDAVNNGACDHVFNGSLWMWSSMFVSGTFLFFLLIVGSIIYKFFDELWYDDEETSAFNLGIDSAAAAPDDESLGIDMNENAANDDDVIVYSTFSGNLASGSRGPSIADSSAAISYPSFLDQNTSSRATGGDRKLSGTFLF